MENNLEQANEQYYKKLTVEDLNKILEGLPDNPFKYPKYCGEGIYEISKGCFTNQKGCEEFMKELRNTLLNGK